MDVVEYLGDEQLVPRHGRRRAPVAKLPVEQRVAPGEDVDLGLPPDKLVLFDAETELAIWR